MNNPNKLVSRQTDRSVNNLAASSVISSRVLLILKETRRLVDIYFSVDSHFQCFFKRQIRIEISRWSQMKLNAAIDSIAKISEKIL